MLRRLSAAAGVAALLAGHAFAQVPPPPQPASAPQGEVQVFEPAFFARYSPNNALDMIQQVPGFNLQEGDAVRGFGGSAGNILINGERPSTKSALSGLLTRIATGAVIRIELVTGASATLDMRGQTKIVNVIVREDALAEPVTFDSTVRMTRDGALTPQAQLSTRRALFGGSLNVSGTLNTFTNNLRYNATGVQTDFSTGITQQEQAVRQLNFEFERDLDLFKLHVNGAWGGTDFDSDRFWRTYTPNAAGTFSAIETQRGRNFQEAVALGGDIERDFGDVDLKLITYNRRERNKNSTQFRTFTALVSPTLVSTQSPRSHAGESILRGQVNWKLSDAHSIEFAAETAYNFLESQNTSSVLISGTDTKVEEYRNEFQISDVWQLASNLTIEPGFKYEFSRIQQDTIEREFEYPKPSITATWRIQEGQQLSVSYEREVAQLSFADFVSAADFASNITTTGNVNLVPERTWAFNAEFEQRFWKGGVLTLFASYDEVEDVQDYVPIDITVPDGPDPGTDPDIIFGDGPGNIGDGTRFSLGLRASIPMDNLGLRGARVDTFVSGGGSEVTDPVTGATREFSDEFVGTWSISYRQDFPEAKWSYGFRYSDGGGSTSYRHNEFSKRMRNDPDISVFVETTQFFGLRIRAGLDDMFPAEFTRDRRIFGQDPGNALARPDRSTGVYTRNEIQHSTNGVQPYIRVSGKF
jgi:hypothetical protein